MTEHPDPLAAYEFDLPRAAIADRPPPSRRDARLLVWEPAGGYRHAGIPALAELLRPGDLLVLNDTRVLRARLYGRKRGGGARVEFLLLRAQAQGGAWSAMLRPGRRLPAGSEVELDGGGAVRIARREEDGTGILEPLGGLDLLAHAEAHGHVPLPPYLDRADEPDDRERYQTVFARELGSVAAPTAGLHLDEALLAALDARGVERATVTLHVGAGTFAPIGEAELASKRLHAERFVVPSDTRRRLADAKAAGGRVVAVGTTACRALESLPAESGDLGDFGGETTLFLRPGDAFRWVDVLITNFHLPRSSLLLLVDAFCPGRWREAYELAIAEGYRFYSYGDANWIERGNG